MGTKRGCRFEKIEARLQKHSMKTAHQLKINIDAALQWIADKARRINVPPLVASLFFAFSLTAFAGLVAVRVTQISSWPFMNLENFGHNLWQLFQS